LIYLDSEYCNTTEELVTPVCCSLFCSKTLKTEEFWVLDEPLELEDLKQFVLKNKNEIFFSYNAVAEGRFFQSIGLNPVDFKWIDGFLEYRLITNHNDKMMFGEQLVEGKIKNTRRPPPKWERSEGEKLGSFKPTHSLAEATFKLCQVVRDTDHKNNMRDILISGDKSEITKNKKAIMDYCTEDTIFLPKIYLATRKEYDRLVKNPLEKSKYIEQALLRGSYSALTANMERRGYPVNIEKTKNFSSSVMPLLDECQREINSYFPEIKPFVFDKKDGKFKWNQSGTRAWLANNVDTKKWLKTDSYKPALRNTPRGETLDITRYLSLSLDAFTNVFDYKHSYPKDNFGAQMVRYLKLKQNLNGFVKSPNKRTFWDSVGSDGRVRCYFNIFGSQASRSQPGSTAFLFLKPAWMRSLCESKKGKAIASYDFSSEEFLISALVSKDKNMVSSYRAGDIYLEFAKLAGAVPKNGKKEDYKKERNLFKATTLGVSYLMSAVGLSAKLTEDTGEFVSEEKAQELIDLFYSSYPDFAQWQQDTIKKYCDFKEYLSLPDGWKLFPDNDNYRSAVNFSIQGYGASILRKAVELCEARGLEVILTLHDALYIEYDSFDFKAIDTFHDCMKEAFVFYFSDKESASIIRLDGYTWSPDYQEDSTIITPQGKEIGCSSIYIDERSESEYKQFSKYFDTNGVNEL